MKQCPICKKDFAGRNKFCSLIECRKISRRHLDETKAKISKNRKKYLQENPEKHPWKRHDRFKSVPCELVKKFLRTKGLNFVEEWAPLEDRFFSVDIAFPDIKLAIEINGNQHYNRDGTLTAYYQERHDLIESCGWIVLELHYSIVYNLEKLEAILDIKEQPDYTEYFKQKELRKSRKTISMPRGQKVLLKTNEKWEPFKQLVIDSDIDFSKFGWVKKVAKLIGIKDQKVNSWMKRYLPDFYEVKCFKRNASVSQRSSKPSLIE